MRNRIAEILNKFGRTPIKWQDIEDTTDQIIALTEQASPEMMSEEEIAEIMMANRKNIEGIEFCCHYGWKEARMIAHALAGKIAKPQAEYIPTNDIRRVNPTATKE